MKIFNRFIIGKLIEEYYDYNSDKAEEALIDIGKPAAKRLIQDLPYRLNHFDSTSFQSKFIFILKDIGEPAVKPLIKALKDEGGRVRECAAEALGEIGDERAVEPLNRILKDCKLNINSGGYLIERHILDEVRYALEKIGKPPIESLIQILKDGDNHAKEYAADALGDIGDERAVEPLIQVLKNKQKSTLKEAIGALGKIKWTPKDDFERAYYLMCKNKWQKIVTMGESAVEPLIEVLGVGDYDIERNAVMTLKMIGESAVEPLIQVLNDDDIVIQQRAVKVIGAEFGAGSSGRVLIDLNIYVQNNAAEALGEIGDERAVEPLIQKLDDENIRHSAAEALGEIGDERAVEPLIQVMKDYELVSAVEALGKIGDVRAVKPLIQELRWGFTSSAARALGKIGDRRAVEPLIRMMKDYNYGDGSDFYHPVINAAEALGKIGDERAAAPLINLIQAFEDPEFHNYTYDWRGMGPVTDSIEKALKNIKKR